MSKRPVDEISGVETTGHDWDGITELDNPLPRWWLWVFYATVAFSVVYWILMPAWPTLTSYTVGLRGHSDRANVAAELAALDARRAGFAGELSGGSLADIETNPELFDFARAAGISAFGDNCATCHGSGGQGTRGYPSLVDDAWLWGGTLDEIRNTLEVGIRSTHPDTHQSQMPAFVRDGLLTPAEGADVVEFVRQISGQDFKAEAAGRGGELFARECVICHGPEGKGDQAQGAPDLTDRIWLYGGDRETLLATVYNSRAGVMPAWAGRLEPWTLDALAVYVHSLGGGN